MVSVNASAIRSSIGATVFRSPFEFTGKAFTHQAFVDAAAIDMLNKNIKTFREPLEEVLKIVIPSSIRLNFTNQGRPAWAPLADSTLMKRGWKPSQNVKIANITIKGAKRKRPKPGKWESQFGMLKQTGRLFKMAMQRNMWEIHNNQLSFRPVFFSQKVTYGTFHQLGTSKMPARPFIQLTDGEKSLVLDIFDDWLRLKISKYWSITEDEGRLGTIVVEKIWS